MNPVLISIAVILVSFAALQIIALRAIYRRDKPLVVRIDENTVVHVYRRTEPME